MTQWNKRNYPYDPIWYLYNTHIYNTHTDINKVVIVILMETNWIWVAFNYRLLEVAVKPRRPADLKSPVSSYINLVVWGSKCSKWSSDLFRNTNSFPVFCQGIG